MGSGGDNVQNEGTSASWYSVGAVALMYNISI